MGQWPGGVGRRWGNGRWNREAVTQRDIEGHIGSGEVVLLRGAGMKPCDSRMVGDGWPLGLWIQNVEAVGHWGNVMHSGDRRTERQ